MIDASFVDVPRQHTTRYENQQIKEGQIPDGWDQKPAFHRQKGTDARHTQKNGERHYGYKNHIKGDLETKLIEAWTVTGASVHDSQALPELIGEEADGETILYAGSACRSAVTELVLEQHGIQNRVHERAWRGTPLTEAQKVSNQEKSRLRARVEHIFAGQSACGSDRIRTIGKARAWFQTGLGNPLHNLCRFSLLQRRAAV